jgi:hypothetical protein
MKRLSILFFSLLLTTLSFGNPVSWEKARLVANNYFALFSGKASHTVANSFSKSYNGITTYYVFNYTGGGFAVVSADDVAIPILAQSNEGFIEEEITNPSARFWFECYSKEIAELVANGNGKSAASPEWSNILNHQVVVASPLDVAPLCTSTWNQDNWYNYYCPTAPTGPGGKALTGCVATAIGQIMKYHNFPAKGVGSHSYISALYGQQTANFGETTYNFASMGNTATSSSYQAVATLLYQAGVSVDMDYSPTSSGSFSEAVPWALSTYFNYDNTTIKGVSKTNYDNITWVGLLKSEMEASRPVYYAGTSDKGGHAWVCDGYRNADSKFHMNWGWGGSSNGYYSVTAASISAGGYTFNSNFRIIYGIKPGDPNLIVRFTNLEQSNSVVQGTPFDIKCSVVTGTPTAVNLYIDNQLVLNTTQTNFTYSWNTAQAPLGTYTMRIEAINATDTVYQQVYVGLSEWVPEASGFVVSSRGVTYIDAIDSLTVWAIGSDGSGGGATINEFTKTTNGGKTWTPGQVLGGTSYGLGNICGLNGNIAYVAVFNKSTQDNTCGVYKTSNGGTTWVQLPGALQGSASFADNVWFWNENEGMCHGDVIDNYFEIYTTSNGGATWTRVPKANIGGGASALTGEGGWTSVIQAVGESTIMFGTNKANLYISNDRGYTWTISPTGISPVTDGVQSIAFKDGLNGLVAQTNTTTVLRETHDGGKTWQTIDPVGPFLKSDMTYVPGTENTYVSTGSGASYSFDGGHSWSQAGGTEYSPFPSVAFVNNHCGWAGGFNVNSTTEGMNKYIGILVADSVRNPVSDLTAQPVDHTVTITWKSPVLAPISYNIYRNDTLLTNTTALQYIDSPVATGRPLYCVAAVYAQGESQRDCVNASVALGISDAEEEAFTVYPNPANDIITIVTPLKFSEIRFVNFLGKVIYSNKIKGDNLQINTSGFEPGMYILQINTGTKVISKKVSVIR